MISGSELWVHGGNPSSVKGLGLTVKDLGFVWGNN